MEGYVVDTAENGEIGIEKAKGSIPDLIISDINMPKADGYEVLAALRKLPETKQFLSSSSLSRILFKICAQE